LGKQKEKEKEKDEKVWFVLLLVNNRWYVDDGKCNQYLSYKYQSILVNSVSDFV